MTQVQAFARGEQKVEEQVAFVDAPLSVAALRRQRHQVEFERAAGAGECAIVEPDGADDAERQVAQAADRREGHHSGWRAAARRIVQHCFQRGAHDFRRNRRGDAALPHVVVNFPDGVAYLAEIVDFAVVGEEKIVEQGEHALHPDIGCAGFGKFRMQPCQVGDETRKQAEQQGAGTFDVAGWQTPEPG